MARRLKAPRESLVDESLVESPTVLYPVKASTGGPDKLKFSIKLLTLACSVKTFNLVKSCSKCFSKKKKLPEVAIPQNMQRQSWPAVGYIFQGLDFSGIVLYCFVLYCIVLYCSVCFIINLKLYCALRLIY